MPSQAEGFGKFSLDLLEGSELISCGAAQKNGLVFRPKADHQMVCFIARAAGIQGLGRLDLEQCQLVIIRPAPLMPGHQAFFALMVGIPDIVAQAPGVVMRLFCIDALGNHDRPR